MNKHLWIISGLFLLTCGSGRIAAQGALLPLGKNVVFVGGSLAAGLDEDGGAAIGPALGYTMLGQVDLTVTGGWLVGSNAYRGSFFGGGVEVHVLKEFPAPLGLSIQGNYQGNFFGDDPDNFFYTGTDYGTYFAGANLYKTLRGAVDNRPAMFYLASGLSGVNHSLLANAGAHFTLQTGFLLNSYRPRSIFSFGISYTRVFDDLYGGNSLGITVLNSFLQESKGK